MGLIQRVKVLNRTKKLIFHQVQENSSCLTAFELEYWLDFLPLDSTETSALPGSEAFWP
jgi:hypothetical protein